MLVVGEITLAASIFCMVKCVVSCASDETEMADTRQTNQRCSLAVGFGMAYVPPIRRFNGVRPSAFNKRIVGFGVRG